MATKPHFTGRFRVDPRFSLVVSEQLAPRRIARTAPPTSRRFGRKHDEQHTSLPSLYVAEFCKMAAFAALAELLSNDESTSSSSSSSSDDEDFEERQALCEAFFRETFSESHRERPKILGFIENVARLYTDEQVSAELPLFIILHEPNFIFLSFPSLQFRQDFRVSRRVAETLIRGFEGSRHYPCSDRGGSPSKTAEEHILVFLW